MKKAMMFIVPFLFIAMQVTAMNQPKIFMPIVSGGNEGPTATPRPTPFPIPEIPDVEKPTPPPAPLHQYDPLPDEFEMPPTRERFGLTSYSYEYLLQYFTPNNYSSQQWTYQDYRNRAIFLRTAQRNHDESRWCMGAYRVKDHPDRCADPTGETNAPESGWVNELALRQWVRDHPGKLYHIGNESNHSIPVGDGLKYPSEYAKWYYYAWELIKSEDSTAAVCSAIPINWQLPGESSTLYQYWEAYKSLTGNPMPSDCWSIHRYAVHGDGGYTIEGEIAFLNEKIDWIESYRGTMWIGRPYYLLNEFGMLSWKYNISVMEQLEYMNGIVPWLISQDRIVEWSWWPSWNPTCTDTCGHLFDELGNLTILGERYYELSLGE